MAIDIDTGALEERIRHVFKSEEHRLFLVTGQMQDPLSNAPSRQAYVTILPFNGLTEEEFSSLDREAQTYDRQESKLSIMVNAAQDRFQVYDTLCQTTSSLPLSDLDVDVQAHIKQAQKEAALPGASSLIRGRSASRTGKMSLS